MLTCIPVNINRFITQVIQFDEYAASATSGSRMQFKFQYLTLWGILVNPVIKLSYVSTILWDYFQLLQLSWLLFNNTCIG